LRYTVRLLIVSRAISYIISVNTIREIEVGVVKQTGGYQLRAGIINIIVIDN